MTYTAVAIGAAIGAWVAAIALILARWIRPAPLPGAPSPLRLSHYLVILADVCLAAGFVVLHPAASNLLLLLFGVVLLLLTLIALVNARTGTLPVVLFLCALGASIALGLQFAAPIVIAESIVFVAVPLAIAALATRGIGFGWGDVAMGGVAAAALGALSAWVAIGAAALLALILSWKRFKTALPFLPYLAAAVAVAILLR